MEPLDIVASTAEAAFATDDKRRIVAWNTAAEHLLGYAARRVCGKRCYQLIRGTDLFGNRFCDETCPLVNMVRRREVVHHFELNVRKTKAEIITADVSVTFVSIHARSQFTIIHILKPVNPGEDVEGLRRPIPDTLKPLLSCSATQPAEPLSRREIAVLRLLGEGRSTSKIARTLFISPETVRNHIKHILCKLNGHSRVEALLIARRHRLI